MAKGRKLTTSRSERYLGSYGNSHGHGIISETAEFGEDDVWSMVDDMINGGDDHSVSGSQSEWTPRGAAASNRNASIIKSRQHLSREDHRHVGGLSLAFDDSENTASPRIVHQYRGQDNVTSSRGRNMATSAPVNVPDWSKIYRINSVESLHDSDDGVDNFEVMPPHEYVARDYSQRAANSVFEGVGRTLKGRDMSRVRDAVWSQTGFDG